MFDQFQKCDTNNDLHLDSEEVRGRATGHAHMEFRRYKKHTVDSPSYLSSQRLFTLLKLFKVAQLFILGGNNLNSRLFQNKLIWR